MVHGRLHEVLFGLHACSGAFFVSLPLFAVGFRFSFVRLFGTETPSLPVAEFVDVKLVTTLHPIRVTNPFRRRRLSVSEEMGEREEKNGEEGFILVERHIL